ncbi:hypothetical protein BJF82_13095 [Kytococcus sp. CUA-901]|nr:hypothetical protein BJF82_13095 [Kytococcus sp. CUA-901]
MESGYFDRSLEAYGQTGRPCRRCGTAIRREEFTNRSSHFCPAASRRRGSLGCERSALVVLGVAGRRQLAAPRLLRLTPLDRLAGDLLAPHPLRAGVHEAQHPPNNVHDGR